MNVFGNETQPREDHPDYWIHKRFQKLEADIKDIHKMVECLAHSTFRIADAQLGHGNVEGLKQMVDNARDQMNRLSAEYLARNRSE